MTIAAAPSQRDLTRNSYHSMIMRCTDASHVGYKHYGGKGVIVCERWLSSFKNFVADLGLRPSREFTLERKTPASNYEPGSVRWATKKEQARNKTNNRWIEHNGERKTLAEWAESCETSHSVFRRRLLRGWTMEEALDPSLRPGVKLGAYPLSEWASDGEWHAAIRGEHFAGDTRIDSVRCYLYVAARRLGVKAHVKVVNVDVVKVRFVRKGDVEPFDPVAAASLALAAIDRLKDAIAFEQGPSLADLAAIKNAIVGLEAECIRLEEPAA